MATILRSFSAPLAYAAVASAWSTFVVPHTEGADDTPALMAAVSNYASDASIVFGSNTIYNVWSPITFPPLKNVEVVISGNLSYSTSIETVQGHVAAANYPGAWISFTGGNNVTLRGNTDPDWGWVDGHGQQWWDIMQQTNRPHGWLFGDVTNGVIRDMKIYKPVAWNFNLKGSTNVHIFNNTILAGSDKAFDQTICSDGFSTAGTNVLFEHNYVVNGDDCLAVANGAKNITWRDSYCEGSHGLSVGSLGAGGQVSSVENVLFENTIMNRTLYAARFKSWTGGKGAAINVTWKNITFIDVMFPIYVTQNYWDQSSGTRPKSSSVSETHIENFLFENFVGVINNAPGYVEGSCVTDPCWYYVPGATGKEVVIFDLYTDTATNIVTKNLVARTLTGAPVAAMCNSSTISSDVGFECRDGPYVPTRAGL
ncbi:glycoside hydrolase family 28 protein [Suillus paluster]|uniref:glycoside hydrolase family 28 protein n=1 Tax=Suillus paluster TaxID=48578 RepID=UPI001B876300|nr:glycoside hydrolase family 28 protein [Suillus paluster]KAG1742701.1 glycoside hydrolase family 28 protein [Suillus paluster]